MTPTPRIVSRRNVLATAVTAAAWLFVAGAGPATAQFGDTVVGSKPLPPHPTPPASSGVLISFLPFQGLPTNTADTIYRRIREKAPQRAMKLVLRLDEPASYRVRGSFSAVGGIASTMIVYRIGVVDGSGQQVHSFVGQEIAPAATGDPWAGIDRLTVDHLADSIVDGLSAWLNRRTP